MVVVFTRRACGPRCSIGDSSRALEISRHAAQQKGTPMQCEGAVVIQTSVGLVLPAFFVTLSLPFFFPVFLSFFLSVFLALFLSPFFFLLNNVNALHVYQ